MPSGTVFGCTWISPEGWHIHCGKAGCEGCRGMSTPYHEPTVTKGRIAFLLAATKLGQGNIFTSVCQEFCPQGGGCLPQCMLGYTSPQSRPPLGADTPQTRQTPPRIRQTPHPPDQADTPPRPGRHPPREAYSSIRSTSGRYASYWNAFLFTIVFLYLFTLHTDWYVVGKIALKHIGRTANCPIFCDWFQPLYILQCVQTWLTVGCDSRSCWSHSNKTDAKWDLDSFQFFYLLHKCSSFPS